MLDEYKCSLCEGIYQDMQKATEHLKSHGQKEGDELKCMKLQRNDMFCKVRFTTFKTLRRHMRENKCKLYCSDVNQEENWSCLVDDFGALNFDNDLAATKEDFTTNTEAFVNRLIVANIQHDVVNEIIAYSKDLASKLSAMNRHSVKSRNMKDEIDSILDLNEEFVTTCLTKFGTRFTRKKHNTNLPYYVAPKQISLDGGESFQYVSVLETLEKVFANKDFRNTYFTFNRHHECQEDIYERYCCGKNYRESDFFQSNHNNIQIQIFFDDVQLTSPLKTRPHKICAIYFIIRNLPAEFVSKLDNMYLVSLSDSELMKKYGCNSMLEQFVQEMKILETKGISINIEDDSCIRKKINLKGTLVQTSFDNLGGNIIFGIKPNFNSNYCCRICICDKKTLKQKTVELKDKIRTKQHYREQITKITQSQGEKLKLETFGITNYTILNDLNFYHTIDNRSQDIMHDIHEGAMPFVLRSLFQYLIQHKIITEVELEQKISSFNYGLIERKNVPSKLCLRKKNLNQNASQMNCLMKHVPFIFINLLQEKDNSKRLIVHKAWVLIEYILKINQIVCSSVIREKDLTDLENYTSDFLSKIKRIFKTELFPKLHFMTHYSSTMRIMGPVKFLQMMRGDAKHQPFTQYAKRCRNYVNICKTLADRHQEVLAAKWAKNNTYCDNVVISKKKCKVVDIKNKLACKIQTHFKILLDFFENIDQVMIIDFLVINSFRFSNELFIIHLDEMHQIEAVLKCNNLFVFLCTKFTTEKFYKFSNSFEIKKTTETLLIRFEELKCKRTYEKKSCNDKTQIIAEDLDMVPVYAKYIV